MRTLNRFAPGFKRIMVAVLAIAMLVSSVSFSKGTNAKAAASTIGSAEDYSVTATDVSDSLCRITFTPTNPAAYVIIHYKVNDGEQVNVGMNAKGSCFEYDINNVKKGDKIDCSFTYNKGGLQYDSSMMTYTTGSAPVTDTSIEAPFGLVVASPANGEISFLPLTLMRLLRKLLYKRLVGKSRVTLWTKRERRTPSSLAVAVYCFIKVYPFCFSGKILLAFLPKAPLQGELARSLRRD